MSSAAARNSEMVQGAIKLAVKANEVGLEAAAGIVDARLEGWKARAGSADYDQRLAKVMVAELTMLAAGIRELKRINALRTLNQSVEGG